MASYSWIVSLVSLNFLKICLAHINTVYQSKYDCTNIY